MTSTQVENARVHPRRRPVINTALPALDTDSLPVSSKMQLKKGETFNTPTSPPNDRDPVLTIRSLPRRTPTSLEAIAASEQRMASILERLTLEDKPEGSAETEDHPVSHGLVAPTEPGSTSASPSYKDGQDLFTDKKIQEEQAQDSDSGLGSSVGSAETLSESTEKADDGIHDKQSAITTSISFDTGSTERRQLAYAACKQIERYILVPLLQEEKLKPFHPLVKSVPGRIVKKQIVCLRDLEKTLLWLAPKFSSSRSSYLGFCEFTIQCLHTSASHLNDRDQRLPADRPYTNGYFIDLVSQVRRYAAMIQASRERMQAQAAAQAVNAEKTALASVTPSASLKGGLSANGRPAEIIFVDENGQEISLASGKPYTAPPPEMTPSFKRDLSFNEDLDEGVARSMARRKKNAPPMDINQKCAHCDKVFKRPCDMTKHEKTHSRPWKCIEPTCKYFTYGWPTEKERDRHINDKHSENPAVFRCHFQPCTYSSKRESNCKQHMEKAHGWLYIRSKNNARNGSKRGSSHQPTPRTPSISTPSSKPTDFPTPSLGPTPSPHESSLFFDNMNFNFADPPAPARLEDFPPLFETNSPYPSSTNSNSGLGHDFNFPTSFNLDSLQTQFAAGEPDGLISELQTHRQSMNSMSIPSTESVPDLVRASMSFNGSPMATTDTTSLNFDAEWNNLGMFDNVDINANDYTVMNMQMPIQDYSDMTMPGMKFSHPVEDAMLSYPMTNACNAQDFTLYGDTSMFFTEN
ncbi:Zinc finger C2H2 [Penicillium macrosclerotiorum]|uniref:Zinc finger C2H2 n=1 Tax=Penicillium macrosclerotiorum TaxID=303699 RepID=UPI0025480B2D|nr:Zinc finger C2H2 [Penicillium macrosclerotiorum]KAJ5692647.1 Zinc finger C2H2 [Penicillium macrosclerotiorum]